MRDRILYHYGIRGADGVVVQNDAQRRMAEPVLRGVVHTIPNGVMPAETTVARDDGAILWAGGVRRIKRPDLFIELARRLPDRKFILIGGGLSTEGDFAAGIETEARGVPNLTMTGWKPNSDVIRMVGDASLVVNTSEVEGFPNVYLEAWNHGVPVVSFSDVDGLIREKEIGAICTGIDDMETTIRGLLADGPRLHGMRERARRLATERYSPEALGPKYVAFFQELLDARRHAR
jgi:glycosyltransferase involved in cell wall biosynthesis